MMPGRLGAGQAAIRAAALGVRHPARPVVLKVRDTARFCMDRSSPSHFANDEMSIGAVIMGRLIEPHVMLICGGARGRAR